MSCPASTTTLKALPGKTHASGLCGGMGIVKYHLSLPESAWLGLLLDNSWGAYFHLSLNTTVGAVASTSARRTSFHKEVVKHYLDLFVDAVALVVDHCLHSIWELFEKAFDIMVVVDVLRNALQVGRVLFK